MLFAAMSSDSSTTSGINAPDAGRIGVHTAASTPLATTMTTKGASVPTRTAITSATTRAAAALPMSTERRS